MPQPNQPFMLAPLFYKPVTTLTLAIFDLDNTLIGDDSDHLWGEFLVEHNFVDAAAYKQQNDQFFDDYKRGELDIIAYQEFALDPLRQYSTTQLEHMHKQFMEAKITPIMLPKAAQLIDKHRADGHCLVIITATNRFITGPIAKALGIKHLIATEAEIVDACYTGKVQGIPSYGQGKIERLEQWLVDQPETLSGSYFYSDSHNDLPLLEKVDHPYAVDPDEKLARIAQERHWPILSLR